MSRQTDGHCKADQQMLFISGDLYQIEDIIYGHSNMIEIIFRFQIMLYMAANFFSCILLIFALHRTTMACQSSSTAMIVFRVVRIIYCFAWIITVTAMGSSAAAEVGAMSINNVFSQ